MEKKGQVTIFIVIALIIAVGIALFFAVRKAPSTTAADVEDPQAYIESCAQDAMKEVNDILLKQGGDLEVKGGIDYKGTMIPYLCYTSDWYNPCINQRPMLTEHIKQQINDYVETRVENCFQVVKKGLEGRYNIEMGEMDFRTELYPRQIAIEINRDFKMTRGEETRTFNTFKTGLNSPIYNLAETAMEIANQQSYHCSFSEQGFMTFYRQYDIRKYWMENETRIYVIKEIPSNEDFIFATRSCAMPIGF